MIGLRFCTKITSPVPDSYSSEPYVPAGVIEAELIVEVNEFKLE
jgi:hypothetical protein